MAFKQTKKHKSFNKHQRSSCNSKDLQKGKSNRRNRQQKSSFSSNSSNHDKLNREVRFGIAKGAFLEGRHALQEAYDANLPLTCIYASDAAFNDPKLLQLLSDFETSGVQINRASKSQLDSRSVRGAHQGIVAKLAPYTYATLADLISVAANKKSALIIACDHITDAGNFGAICRTAEVCGACGVIVPDKRCAPVTAATYKTSAGAIAHLPIAKETNLVRSLQTLKDEGFWIVGASEHASCVLWDAELSGRIVLVMGSEDKGLSRLVQDTCDMLVSLPQYGRVESLNVAQATTALSYEFLRQNR